MSEIKSDKLSPRTASGTVVLGDSGDTFSIPAGVAITNSGTATGFGGGKLLQVVHVTDAGPGTQTSSSSWVDTDTTASITCSATTSKVLVMFGGSCTGYRASDANQYTGKYRLYETATTTAYPSGLYFARGAINAVSSDSGNRFGTYVGGAWLHSPSSTSALTYTVQITKNNDSTFWNETSDETATITLMEIGA